MLTSDCFSSSLVRITNQIFHLWTPQHNLSAKEIIFGKGFFDFLTISMDASRFVPTNFLNLCILV